MNLHVVRKPLRPVVAQAIGRGCWRLEKTGRAGKHSLRLVHTTGRIVPLHCSKVSEGRAPQQLKSQLARIERALA